LFDTDPFAAGHDAWHGSVSRSNPRLNAFIGRTALTLHAWFDFDHLARIHRQHHAHYGIPGQDPDMHPRTQGMFSWFIALAFDYATPMQVLYLAAELIVLHLVVQVPVANLLMFLILPMALSTFRLFYFLIFIPHKTEEGLPLRAIRSFTGHWVVATLLCFNAVYHDEHHRAAYLPWFALPRAVR
jgi:fatty acid desaturase